MLALVSESVLKNVFLKKVHIDSSVTDEEVSIVSGLPDIIRRFISLKTGIR